MFEGEGAVRGPPPLLSQRGPPEHVRGPPHNEPFWATCIIHVMSRMAASERGSWLTAPILLRGGDV